MRPPARAASVFDRAIAQEENRKGDVQTANAQNAEAGQAFQRLAAFLEHGCDVRDAADEC